jgi:hypothetical protein
MFAVANQWVTIYQFWIHTCVVRRVGLLEYVLNTPSHHRVHHDRRVHKNFAGVFIIWDRMFGTFHDELHHGPPVAGIVGDGSETCYFGIQETLSSYAEVATQSLLLRSMFLGPMGFVQGPGMLTCTVERLLPKAAPPSQLRLRIDQKSVPFAGKVYLVAQLALCIVGMILCALVDEKMSNADLAAATAFMLAGMVSSGLVIDGATSAVCLEVMRNGVGVYAGFVRQSPWLVRACAVSAVAAAVLGVGNRLLGRPTVAGTPSLKQKKE